MLPIARQVRFVPRPRLARRSVRAVRTLAALLAVAAIAQPPAASALRPGGRRLRGVQALAAAPCPSPPKVPSRQLDRAALLAARKGDFAVFGSQPTHLVPPIDWHLDPLHSHAYRQNLHKLRYLEPLLASYARSGNTTDLGRALAIGLDWIQANPPGGASTPREAWSDKVVGDRVPYLGYLGRAAACAGLLTDEQSQLFLDSMTDHATFLVDPTNHPDDNHGLFVDIGLVQIGQLYPFLGPAAQWRALARRRFVHTLTARLSGGVWLEHSTAYQFLAIVAVEQFLAAYGPDDELDLLLPRMRAAALWFVEPDGLPTQFGDSDLDPIPDWAAAAPVPDGMHVFPGAGFAFVDVVGSSGERGYLAVTAGFHNLTHKHADDLSFELYDRGERVVSDTGQFDKDPGTARDFVVSSQAHSTFTVDGANFPIDDPSAPYGSGIRAWGQGSGWYAVEAVNPMLARQGVRQTRCYLYKPNRALIVVDGVHAAEPHDYTRYLQLGPQMKATPSSEGFGLEPIGGRIRDVGVPSTYTAVRGSTHPLQGRTSPSFRVWQRRTSIAVADTGTGRLSALSISLAPRAPAATRVRADDHSIVVTLGAGTVQFGSLRVQRVGRTLQIVTSVH